ncbi:MAG: hypothetical protein OJI74_16485 [Rhodanobacter thiooxydans]|nr:hypothetical protein [Rhodanobacter thiooxydans]
MAGIDLMNTAMKNLYAVLSPGQKTLADQRFGHAGGPRMGFWPRHSAPVPCRSYRVQAPLTAVKRPRDHLPAWCPGQK